MKINFIGLKTATDRRGWDLLMYCASAAFSYEEDVVPLLQREGMYATKAQYEAVKTLFDEQYHLEFSGEDEEFEE